MKEEKTEPSPPNDPQPDDPSESSADKTAQQPPPAPLLSLRDGLPEITETPAQLADVVDRVARGSE